MAIEMCVNRNSEYNTIRIHRMGHQSDVLKNHGCKNRIHRLLTEKTIFTQRIDGVLCVENKLNVNTETIFISTTF